MGSGEQEIIVTGKSHFARTRTKGHSEVTSMIRGPFALDGRTRFAVMSFRPMALDFDVKPLSFFLYLRSRLLTA